METMWRNGQGDLHISSNARKAMCCMLFVDAEPP